MGRGISSKNLWWIVPLNISYFIKVHLHQLLLELHRLAADPSLQDQAAGEDVAAAVFDRLEAGLAEMTRVFSNLDTLLVQPARHLPCNRRYQAATPAADPNDPARSYFR